MPNKVIEMAAGATIGALIGAAIKPRSLAAEIIGAVTATTITYFITGKYILNQQLEKENEGRKEK